MFRSRETTGELRHQGQLIPYRVERRKRVTRRLHLRTATDGSLLVIAPPAMTKADIQSILQQRVTRVARFLVKDRKRQQETPVYAYQDGEMHYFLGLKYRLRLVHKQVGRSEMSINGREILVSASDLAAVRVQRIVEAGFRIRAIEHFSGRMEQIAVRAPWIHSPGSGGLQQGKLPELRVRKMKRTWGSCSARGVITLNTRLIRATPEAIDYVISHELCHLVEMNHSKAFYALQDQVFPDWPRVRNELRQKAHIYLAN